APAPAARTVRVPARAPRLPDWRTGQLLDLSGPDTRTDNHPDTSGRPDSSEPSGPDSNPDIDGASGPDTRTPADPGQDSTPEASGPDADSARPGRRSRTGKRKTRPGPGDTRTDSDPDASGPDTRPDRQDEEDRDGGVPPWDPVAVAGRLVRAHQTRPVHGRIQALAQKAVTRQRRIGPGIYTATGAWAGWKIGLTPWLIDVTAGAPLGISLLLVWFGWSLHRASDQAVLLVAWCGRAAYTSTVLAVALQP
ncbi:MAG TPA: hypothetical protein VK545_05040, partial [Streptomyces sp.]|nr:hypothetical protein [Streptomyces sp.]